MNGPESGDPDSTDPWARLDKEFDVWETTGRTASLWWRDDDASRSGPRLDRLLALTEKAGVGLLLAVIPARVEAALAEGLGARTRVAQHGYAHVNHAPRGQGLGAWELGSHRPREDVLAELEAGRDRLAAMFAIRFVPVVVPPWNRIDPGLFPGLAERGYIGVSSFGPRGEEAGRHGLIEVNAHCDPIRWKQEARFAGEAKTLGALVEHLRARRSGEVAASEPSGFLTHHRDLDEPGWDFCERLAGAVAKHSAARWLGIEEVFAGRMPVKAG
ncbi:MAG: polysaccharide deacetylase family protein [Alphaproteobacteria bacterium]